MKTSLGICWAVLTWRLIFNKELENVEEDVLWQSGANWYRVWVSPSVTTYIEGEDYVDVLADDQDTALEMASRFLPSPYGGGYVPSLIGTSDLYRLMDRTQANPASASSEEDWGMDDQVTPLRHI